MKTLFILTFVWGLGGAHAFAQENASNLAGRNYDEAREAEIDQKARHRLYPGGKDESDLKVQSPLITPVRKLAPTGEAAAGETSSGED